MLSSAFKKSLLLSAVCLLAACGSSEEAGTLAANDLAKPPVSADAITQAGPFEARRGGMMGSFGVNLDTYFAQETDRPIDRITRLEHVVSALQRDLKTMAAPVQHYASEQAELQAAADQARMTALLTPPAPPAMAPPVKLTETKAPVKAPAATSAPSVQNVRIGEHTDKIRIVLDMNVMSDYSADLDNNEKILVIDLPQAGWSAAKEKNFAASPLLKSYKVESRGDKGSMLILQLKGPTAIVAQQKLVPQEGMGPRIVIDLKK